MRLLPLFPATAMLAALIMLAAPVQGTSLGRPGAGIYLLSANNQLAMISDTLAAQPTPLKALAGLTAGDSLVAIDVRPANQELYGLAVNTSAGTLQLYHLTPATGLATAVGASFVPLNGGEAIPLTGLRFGIDFNPMVDRLRVTATNGMNLRINPNTGGLTGMDLFINSLTTRVDETAYTNNAPGSLVTTLYTLDASTDSLYIQTPPNTGIQTSAVPVRISGSPVNFSEVGGFDIAPGVDAPASNVAASGAGYAALNVAGATGLYRIDLATGNATLLGVPGLNLRGLAVKTQIPVAYALRSNGATLYRFRTDAPGAATSAPISGIDPSEVLAGVAFRPASGQLLGFGVNAADDKGTLYLVDPQSGGCTAVGATGQISFTEAPFTGVSLPVVSSGYGLDFNPQADRIRVITASGLNFRINPLTGGGVDGDSGALGTNTDGALNGGTTTANSVAYTNAYQGATTTTLYALDASTRSVWIMNPPNNGSMVVGVQLTLSGSPLNFAGTSALEIVPSPGGRPANADPAATYALAALRVSGSTGLYWINLTTGAVILTGTIGDGSVALSSLAVCSAAGAGFAPMSWPSLIGSQYSIETSTDLNHWQALPGTITATGTTTTAPVELFSKEGRRFWRAVGL